MRARPATRRLRFASRARILFRRNSARRKISVAIAGASGIVSPAFPAIIRQDY